MQQILKRVGKPVAFGKYTRMGPEAVFAISMWVINALFTNVVSFGGIQGLIDPNYPLSTSELI